MITAKTLRWPVSLTNNVRKLEEKRMKSIEGLKGCGYIVTSVGVLLWITREELAIILIPLGLFLLYKWLWKWLEPSTEEKLLSSGNNGEMRVARTLDNLPDGWIIINDIIINNNQIDHLVLGPNGIFCIETKNWNTAGTDARGSWYKYKYGKWHQVEENPAKQNMSHIFALKEFLYEKCRIRSRINSIVVLSNPDGAFSITQGDIYPGNTIICSLPYLQDTLLNWQGRLAPKPMQRIADAIMREVQEK